MLKRSLLALAGLLVLAQAHAAGTIPGFSLTPQFNLSGAVMGGCKLYVIQAGTVSTPQNPYQDTGLTTVLPNPLTCDASGRLPQWFVADGLIKLRLTDQNGVQIFVGDNLLVVGASSGGGGGGGTIDPTTIAATGDTKWAYGTSVLTGWVRMNGRTIGSATSGASERANSDTQALFQYLWGADANLVVSGGRGANAAADWAANKTIALPDGRGRAFAAMDDIGNTDASRLSVGGLASCRFTLGCGGGESAHTQSVTEMPSHNHGVNDPGHFHTFNSRPFLVFNSGTSTGTVTGGTGSPIFSFNQSEAALTGISIQSAGGGSAFNVMQPTILMTPYIKL